MKSNQFINKYEYHPFGVGLKNRDFTSEKYRYGFNGQESVDEVSGSKSHYIAEHWMYDSRIGRRWNIDPINNPSTSTYACFYNNPILFNDPNGDSPRTDKPFFRIFGIGFFWRQHWKLTDKGPIYWSRTINPNIYGGSGDKIIPIDNTIDPASRPRTNLTTIPKITIDQIPTNNNLELKTIPNISNTNNEDNSNSDDINSPGNPPPPELKINFNISDNTFVNPTEAQKQMEPVLKWLNDNPNKKLILYGNTGLRTDDEVAPTGSGKTIWDYPTGSTKFPTVGSLMKGRADSVKEYLKSQGIDASRIETRKGNQYDSPAGRVITTQTEDIKK